MTKWYPVHAIKHFVWKGLGSSYFIHKGELIEVDRQNWIQLREEGLVEDEQSPKKEAE